MTDLARRYGAEPTTSTVKPTPPKSLFDLAAENAVEGCVRETFGALVAQHQARAAADPAIARAMAAVAADETRHAALAWEIAAWAEAQLSPTERDRLHELRADAVADLRADAAMPRDLSIHRLAGWPTPRAGVALVDALARDLWADAARAA